MIYKLTLHRRQTVARNRNNRYRSDPAYRLARINEARTQRGAPPIASLDDIGRRRPVDTWGRDDRGRFVPDRRA